MFVECGPVSPTPDGAGCSPEMRSPRSAPPSPFDLISNHPANSPDFDLKELMRTGTTPPGDLTVSPVHRLSIHSSPLDRMLHSSPLETRYHTPGPVMCPSDDDAKSGSPTLSLIDDNDAGSAVGMASPPRRITMATLSDADQPPPAPFSASHSPPLNLTAVTARPRPLPLSLSSRRSSDPCVTSTPKSSSGGRSGSHSPKQDSDSKKDGSAAPNGLPADEKSPGACSAKTAPSNLSSPMRRFQLHRAPSLEDVRTWQMSPARAKVVGAPPSQATSSVMGLPPLSPRIESRGSRASSLNEMVREIGIGQTWNSPLLTPRSEASDCQSWPTGTCSPRLSGGGSSHVSAHVSPLSPASSHGRVSSLRTDTMRGIMLMRRRSADAVAAAVAEEPRPRPTRTRNESMPSLPHSRMPSDVEWNGQDLTSFRRSSEQA